MIAAVVPMKPLAEAKGRLAGVLADADRRRLAAAMVEEVLGQLLQCRALDRVDVVTADQQVAAIAARRGVGQLAEDAPNGLDSAMARAAELLVAAGATTMLYVPGDAPLVTVPELEAIVGAVSGTRCVLVPSHDGGGTNALLVSPPDALAFAFGPGSFARHLALARAAGIDAVTLSLAGLGRDIDTPEDLRMLAGRRAGDPRYGFLDDLAAAAAAPAPLAAWGDAR